MHKFSFLWYLDDVMEITDSIYKDRGNGTKSGTKLLLDKLHSCKKPNVYRSFVDILANSGKCAILQGVYSPILKLVF